MPQEWDAVLHAADDQVQPQRLEAAAPLVEDARQPVEQGARLQLDAVVVAVVVGDLLVDVLLDELEVGVVAAAADDRVVVDLDAERAEGGGRSDVTLVGVLWAKRAWTSGKCEINLTNEEDSGPVE